MMIVSILVGSIRRLKRMVFLSAIAGLVVIALVDPSPLQAYARSVEIWIHNKSLRPLELKQVGPLHGRWVRQPTGRIPGGAQERIMSISSGDFTGTEGWVEYVFGDTWGAEKTDLVYISWNNPFVGTSECKIFVYEKIGPAPPTSYNHSAYRANVSGCPGNDAKAYMSVEVTNPSYDRRMMMQVPHVPENVRAQSDRNGSYIQWSVPAGSESSFLREPAATWVRRAEPGEWARVAELPPESTSYSDRTQPGRTNRYKVCSVNIRGESCSEPVEATRIPVYQERQVDIGPSAGRNFGPPFIQRVAPESYTKVMAQAPEYFQVQLTFEGSPPDRARYSVDEGLSMACGAATAGAKLRCWTDAAQLVVVGNAATVWIPYSAIQQTQHQLHIKLSNNHGESIGAVRVLPPYVQSPSVKTEIAPQKNLSAPGRTPSAPRGLFGR